MYGVVALMMYPEDQDPRVLRMAVYEGADESAAIECVNRMLDELYDEFDADEDYWVERARPGCLTAVLANDDVTWWVLAAEVTPMGETEK